jgi:pyroglutamyl-peptidase
MNPKILVTGFKPFLHHTQNCSEILLKQLQNERRDIETLLLPVSFQNSFSEFKKHWQAQGPYKGVLMLGQANGRKEICLERVALNWMESKVADNEGLSPSGKKIVRDAPDSYIMDFFPGNWAEVLKEHGPTNISLSAGSYVCNNLYFQVAHELKPKAIPNLFVHLPLLHEQVQENAGAPSLDGVIQKKVLNELLNMIHSL